MDRHGLDNQDIANLKDMTRDSMRSFLITFVFLRNDNFFPYIVWPGQRINDLISSFDDKSLCDIGAIYLFKDSPAKIKDLYDSFCDQKLDAEGIWTYFMCSSKITEIDLKDYGFPGVKFMGKDKNGIFDEIDFEDINAESIDSEELEEYWGNDEPDVMSRKVN